MYLNREETPDFQWMKSIRLGSNLQREAAKSFNAQHIAASYRSKPPKQKHCPGPRVDKMAWDVFDLPFLILSLVTSFVQSAVFSSCLLFLNLSGKG